MLPRICPWGMAAFVLAVLGLLLASLVGVRWLTLTLSALGALVALVGIGTARESKDRVWLALGGILSGVVLCLTLFVPGLINDFWALDVAVPEPDPNQLVLVPHNQPRDPGRSMAADEWADTVKDAIRQGDLFVCVESVTAGRLPEKGTTSYLIVNLRVFQIEAERGTTFQDFKDKRQPVLRDDSGREYPFLGHRQRRPFITVIEAGGGLVLDQLLVFELPPPGSKFLKLQIPASAWGRQGACRFCIGSIEPEEITDMPKLIAHYKNKLRTPSVQPPDAALGRAVFVRECQECHTLFGVGNKVGPDLTDRGLTPDGRQKRTDLDFLVTNIVDPSAEIAKGYEPSIVETTAGLVIHGIVKEENADAVTLQISSKIIVLPRAEIERIQLSKVSLMPKDILKPLDEHEVRSLFAYLTGQGQVPLLARPDNAVHFFNGQNLNFWQSVPPGWKVVEREFVAPEPQGGVPALLISEMLLATDFRFALQFHPGKEGRWAVQLRGAEKPDHSAAGPRVEFTAGGRVGLFDREGKRINQTVQALADLNTVQADSWNKLEIIVKGKRLQVRLGGKDTVALEDAGVPARAVIALEGPGSPGQNVRFRFLDVQVFPDK
jgi:putative heme-binding domain-containing protein